MQNSTAATWNYRWVICGCSLLILMVSNGMTLGGMAVFDIETPEQLVALRDPGPLAGWDFRTHPLIFAGSAVRFLFQFDYTMQSYGDGRRLTTLFDQYRDSDDYRKNDGR